MIIDHLKILNLMLKLRIYALYSLFVTHIAWYSLCTDGQALLDNLLFGVLLPF